jgi:hypothetical protein
MFKILFILSLLFLCQGSLRADDDNLSIRMEVGFGENPKIAPVHRVCQATLVERHGNGEYCEFTLLTAGHCLVTDERKKATFFQTKAFGRVTDFQFVVKNPDLELQNDIALIYFNNRCEFAASLWVVSVGTPPAKDTNALGEPIPVYYASKAHGRLILSYFPSDYSSTQKKVQLSYSAAGIFHGDSGGGVFLINQNTKLPEVLGVVSATIFYSDAPTIRKQSEGSHYVIATLDTDWIKEQLKIRFSQTTEIFRGLTTRNKR